MSGKVENIDTIDNAVYKIAKNLTNNCSLPSEIKDREQILGMVSVSKLQIF